MANIRVVPEGIERRKLKDGSVAWVARVSETAPGARRVRASKTFPTVTQARQWRRAKLGEVERGARLGGPPETLSKALAVFTEGISSGAIRTPAGRAYKPSTVRGYQQAARDVAAGPLGAARIARITRRDVQALVDDLAAAGQDASTVRNAIKPLQAVFRRAVEDGVLSVNPTTGLRLPAVEGKRERIATPDEAARMLAVLPMGDSRLIWALAFYSGLRLGELRALRWSDIDRSEAVIRVERALDAKGSEIDVKSKAGRRTVPIVARLEQELGAIAPTVEISTLVLGRHGRPCAVSLPRTAQRIWAKHRAEEARKAALGAESECTAPRPAVHGFEPILLHEARHTFASFLIAAGVNAKAISAALGHASIAITLDRYGHLMPGSTGEVRDHLDAYLASADTDGRLRQLAD
jgi:integrase